MMDFSAEKNKQTVLSIYQHAFQNHTDEFSYDNFRNDFIQHNPWMRDGVEHVRDMHMFNFQFEPLRMVAQGNLVAVQGIYHLVDSMSEMAIFGVDIWRLQDHKIAEHWDVLELMPYCNKESVFGDISVVNSLDTDQLMFNKGLVNTFAYLTFHHRDFSNLNGFVADSFKYHHKYKTLNLEEFISHIKSIPVKRYEIKQLIASGEHIFVHSFSKNEKSGKNGIEIYRTNTENKIEEMWSISQELIHINRKLNPQHNY